MQAERCPVERLPRPWPEPGGEITVRPDTPAEAPLRQATRQVYLHTGSFEFLVLGCQILVYKLAADYWGTLGFSEYVLARRVLALMQPAVMLGLSVALVRYVAWERSASEGRIKGYLVASLCVFAAMLLLASIPLIGLREVTSLLIFGDRAHGEIVSALLVLLTGVGIHLLAHSYLRGQFRARAANWLQLVVLGFGPVLVFLYPGQTLPEVLVRLGVISAIFGGGVLAALLLSGDRAEGVTESTRMVTRFGASRVPADFLHMVLLGVPPLLLAHSGGVEVAGQLAFAMSLLSLAASVFAPVSVVLLPTVSRLAADGSVAHLRVHLRTVTALVLAGALVITLVGFTTAQAAITAYLGPTFTAAVPVVRLCLLAITPYALFMALRSTLDAVDERALNTRNLSLAAGVGGFIMLSDLALGGSTIGIIAGVLVGFYLLGALTIRDAFAGSRLARRHV